MNPTLNIIGCGRAAGSLARLWVLAGMPEIGQVMNRSRASSRACVQRLGCGRSVAEMQDFEPAAFWMIGTGDAQIEQTAERLAASGIDLEDAVVFHLAGRCGSEVLQALHQRGCLLAAVHPVRSLDGSELKLADFAGTACVAAGDAAALERLEPLFSLIGAEWFAAREISRGLYHAALSIVSNVTKAVTWKAHNWLQEAGLPEATARTITQQLLTSTVEDIARSGAKQSITGPVVRGDSSTIATHLQALEAMPGDDAEVYRVLARVVLELAEERGDLDAQTLQRFTYLLKP